MLIHDIVISSIAVASVFLGNGMLTSFQIRQAKFFSDRLNHKEHREDIELLLLFMLDNKNRGIIHVGEREVADSVGSYLDLCKNEMESSGRNQMVKNSREWFLSPVKTWFKGILSNASGSAFSPFGEVSRERSVIVNELIRFDTERNAVCFQLYHQATSIVHAKIMRLLGDHETPLSISKLKEVICNAAAVCFKGRSVHVRQLAAALLALKHRFTVISGGPGTGKSTVLHLVVRSLHEYYSIAPEKIALCAPTGRAKARLYEAITRGLEGDDPLTRITSFTIHSLLARNGIGSVGLQERQMLPYAVVIVDEASMMDLSLFAMLIEKLPDSCRIILAGDSEQLPPIEAGAVLGDLTGGFLDSGITATLTHATMCELNEICQSVANVDNRNELSNLATDTNLPMIDRVVFLTKNYRSEKSIITWWNDRVAGNSSDGADTSVVVTGAADGSALTGILDNYISGMNLQSREVWDGSLRNQIIKMNGMPDAEACEQLRELIASVKILCCVNDGAFGKSAVNNYCHQLFGKLGRLQVPSGKWVDGQPVMVVQNQGYPEKLYNGDSGIILVNEGIAYGCFPVMDSIRMIPVSRIIAPENAYAVSVHKAQGSEYNRVIFILPEKPARNISRQLVYTAVTRAKKRLQIIDRRGLLENIAALPVERRQGILQRSM